MQQRFDITKAPIPPLRAEPRFAGSQGATGHIQGVNATSGGLVRSTLIAGGAALAILTLFYLPAEYGIDPTGVGGMLGLGEMGLIKQQLYAEADAQDLALAAQVEQLQPIPSGDVLPRLDRIDAQLAAIAAIIGADALIAAPPAAAVAAPQQTVPVAELLPELAPAPETAAAPVVADIPEVAAVEAAVAEAGTAWRDEIVFTLAPTEAKEIKLVMAAGDVASFDWISEGGGVNYTQHGDDGGANEVRYEDGRAEPGQDGTMTAPFAGNHGWFWRNRGDAPVTVTLRLGGAYAKMIEIQ